MIDGVSECLYLVVPKQNNPMVIKTNGWTVDIVNACGTAERNLRLCYQNFTGSVVQMP